MAFVFAEVLVRMTGFAPSSGLVSVTEGEYSSIPGIFSPNQRVLDRRKPALEHRVTINNLGYRGNNFPLRKPDDEYRIFMAGDSFTYGDFVDDDESLPYQLETELREHCGNNVRVINGGVGGMTIVGARMMIERGLVLEPDTVVLTHSENNEVNLAVEPLWDRLANNRKAKSRFPLSIIYPVFHNTAIWHLALDAIATVKTAERERAVSDTPQNPGHERERVRRVYTEIFLELRNMLSESEIPLMFSVFPMYTTVAGDNGTERVDWALEMAKQSVVPSIGFLDALRESGLPVTSLYLLPHDGHASGRGNAIAATALANSLIQTESLREFCQRNLALPSDSVNR